MVVKCIRPVKSDGTWHPVGGMLDVADVEGKRLISLGAVASLEEPKPEPEPEVVSASVSPEVEEPDSFYRADKKKFKPKKSRRE